MAIIKRLDAILLFLRRLYGRYPKSFSSVELGIYASLFFFNVWGVSFWYWGIYRHGIPFPKALEFLSYKLWQGTGCVHTASSILGFSMLVLSFVVRKDSLKELGIRIDNSLQSGRECVIITLVSILTILSVSMFYLDRFCSYSFASSLTHFLERTPQGIFARITVGIIQQFLLQSLVLVRFIQIWGKRVAAVLSATALFSLAHLPNVELMVCSFFFGLMMCLLFLRNRNIFTLGSMHGILSVFFISFLVPGLMADFKIGPARDNLAFIAQLDYTGGKIRAYPSEKKTISILVTNKSTGVWDSTEREHPVYLSYHLLDAKGETLAYDNARTPLKGVMRTDESATVGLILDAPSKRGEYFLEVDLVKENMTWFKKKGSRTILIPVSVD